MTGRGGKASQGIQKQGGLVCQADYAQFLC
jgi:hypothetical protein